MARIEPAKQWATRTSADAKSLLLEVARALRGFSFYDESDRKRGFLLDRTYRALAGELDRAGPIDLSLGGRCFEMIGLSDRLPTEEVFEPLDSALERHRIARVRFDPSLSRNALHGFLSLLSQPTDRFENPASFVRSLRARDAQGICINGLEDDERPSHTPELSATPPRAAASLATARDGVAADCEQLAMETHPLDSPANSDPGERLRARLIELERTTEDEVYQRRASDIGVWARQLFESESREDCYRALLVLADHAVGCGGRPEAQARCAAATFRATASGERLDDLIARASCATGQGVRAAQLLLQLGEAAAPALFRRICEAEDPDAAAALRSLMIALGVDSLPTLVEAIGGNDPERAHMGIRLAGELQNPAALPALLASLPEARAATRKEILRALELIPGEDARRALAFSQETSPNEADGFA